MRGYHYPLAIIHPAVQHIVRDHQVTLLAPSFNHAFMMSKGCAVSLHTHFLEGEQHNRRGSSCNAREDRFVVHNTQHRHLSKPIVPVLPGNAPLNLTSTLLSTNPHPNHWDVENLDAVQEAHGPPRHCKPTATHSVEYGPCVNQCSAVSPRKVLTSV